MVSFELSRINERAAWAFCLPSREGIEFVGLFRDALIPIRPGAVGADASMVDVLGAISATCLRNSWCESFAWYPVGALGRRPESNCSRLSLGAAVGALRADCVEIGAQSGRSRAPWRTGEYRRSVALPQIPVEGGTTGRSLTTKAVNSPWGVRFRKLGCEAHSAIPDAPPLARSCRRPPRRAS